MYSSANVLLIAAIYLFLSQSAPKTTFPYDTPQRGLFGAVLVVNLCGEMQYLPFLQEFTKKTTFA